MPTTKTAVVTGANRGIGLAICQSLAATVAYPLVLYAVLRSGTNLGLEPSNPSMSVKYGSLSLRDPASIAAFASRLRQEQGGCDILINNAGVYHYSDYNTAAQRQETIDVNYRGTLAVCQALLPAMKPGGRIVNMSSASGSLSNFSRELQARFRNPENTLEDVEKLMREYEELSAQNKATQHGWARKPYWVSKAAENAMTIALARAHPNFLINCCCPGWVSTDLGNQPGQAPKSVEDGAKIPIRVGFGDIGGVTGKFWANPGIADTGEGRVQAF